MSPARWRASLAATGMTLGDVIEHCQTIGAPGETLLRKAGGGPIEMSSLSARFRGLIVAVLGPDAHAQYEWLSLHEVRSLSARTYIAEGMAPATVQTTKSACFSSGINGLGCISWAV